METPVVVEPDPLITSTDCTGTANSQLSESGLALSNEPGDLSVAAAGTLSKVIEGDELATHREAWTACMSRAGFSGRTFPIPIKVAERGTDIELPIATADIACRQSTGLADAIVQLLQADAAAYASTHDVASWMDARQREIDTAVEVLESRGLLTSEELDGVRVSG